MTPTWCPVCQCNADRLCVCAKDCREPSHRVAHDYEAACRNATTNQGLDPIVALLAAEGLPCEVEQTGGFCMVAYVRPTPEGPHLGITEADEPAIAQDEDGAYYELDRYLIVHYADLDDCEGTILVPDAPLAHVLDYVSGYVRGFIRTNSPEEAE